MVLDVQRLRAEWFDNPRGDILAGLVVALALIPEAIAFSIIAGVDPKVAFRAFKPVNRFLIAFDGGPSATKAVDIISKGPLLKGAECHLLMVGGGHGQAKPTPALGAAASRLRDAGYTVHAEMRLGEPENVITEYVDRVAVDLLVMGAYGYSRIRNLIIGSTTTAMVRGCKVPVLMIR
jgi:nucleotide-binding universal stress UspA family protein